jgi:hypothetical protein
LTGDFFLKWVKRIALTLSVLILIGVIAAALVADLGFHAVRSSPRIKHDEILGLDSGVRLMVQPEFATGLVNDFLKQNAPNAPAWLVAASIPYEFSLQSAPDISTNKVQITCFINDRRLGPLLASIPERMKELDNSGITWTTPVMESSRRGELLYRGSVPIDKHSLEIMSGRWGLTKVGAPLPMEKTHFIELRCDNRDGSLYALSSAFSAQRVAKAGGKANVGQIMVQKGLDTYVRDISDIHAFADLTGEKGMTVSMTIECALDCLENVPRDIHAAVDWKYAEIAKQAVNANIHLEGETVLDGFTIRGNYQTDDFRALLPILAGPGRPMPAPKPAP